METITKKVAVPLCMIFITLFHFSSISQSTDCIDSHSGTVNSGTIDEYCEGTLKSNTTSSVSFEINSNVKYRSASQIHLQPGFHAGNFATTNKFHAQIDNLTVLEPTNGDYEQLEKMEWAITIPNMNISRYNYDANWSNQTLLTNLDLKDDINDFFDQTTYPNPYTNPYDPDDIDIEVTFKHESGQTFKTWGFYYRGFEYDNDGSTSMEDLPESWEPVTNDFGWRVRFAPPLTGNYTSCIKITTYRNTAHETVYENCNNTPFNVITSDNPGYLKFNAGSKYMSFSETGETYLPVGYNIIGDNDANKYTNYPSEYYFNKNYLENLIGKGNNAKVTNGPNYWVEFDEPLNYDYHQIHMWELDKVMNVAEENNIYVILTLFFHEEYWSGDENLFSPPQSVGDRLASDGSNQTRDFFGEHPYKKDCQIGDNVVISAGGIIDDTYPLSDFFGNNNSKKLVQNRLRYTIARWGYSTHLNAYDLFGEIDNVILKQTIDTAGNMERKYELAEPNIHVAILDWVEIMAGYLKLIDPNHLVNVNKFSYTNLPATPGTDVFDAPSLDYVTYNDYGSKRNHNLTDRADHVQLNLTEYSKPVAIEEMGHGGSHHVTEMYYGESFHNAIWSSSFTGAIGPGTYWYKQYLSDIGLKKAETEHTTGLYGSSLSSFDGSSFEVATAANTNFWPSWYKITDANCSVRQGISGWDDTGEDITPDFTHHYTPLTIFLNSIMPTNGVNLQDGYTPQKYPSNSADIIATDYYSGNELEAFMLIADNKNKLAGWVHNRSNYWGNLDFITAYDDPGTDYETITGFTPDPLPPSTPTTYLYDGGAVNDTQDDDIQEVIEYTNSTGMPSFQITGLDNNRQYTVQWYNTLGVTSWSPPGSPTTSANTSSSGVLTVIPPDMTNAGDHDYAFIITGGASTERKSRIIESGGNSSLQLTPNPSKGIFNLSLTENTGGEVQVINSVGALVYQKTITETNTLVIDLSHKPKGVYYIKVITESGVKVEKIIKN